jgi:hypothetical protein
MYRPGNAMNSVGVFMQSRTRLFREGIMKGIKMSLFKCSKCGCVENTALGEFWPKWRTKDWLCSECATGKWHGKFPKENAVETGYYIDSDGFIYHPDTVDEKTMEWVYNRKFKMAGKLGRDNE